MATETHIRILGTDQWEKTVSFYDQKSRPVRTYKQNHLGGYTDVESRLDFRGLPIEVRTRHLRDPQGIEVVLSEHFRYDHRERLLSHVQQIEGEQPQLIAANTYDALGMLTNKKVGGSGPQTVDQERWQSIDYRYNIRGWLTDINTVEDRVWGKGKIPPKDKDDLFAFKIAYDRLYHADGFADRQYNGNIAQTYWRSGSDDTTRGYDYNYDMLNRLRNAEFNNGSGTPYLGSFNESIAYDLNGNISSLYRTGEQADRTAYDMDILNYAYQGGNGNSNLLTNVGDEASFGNTDGFTDGNTNPALDDYEYDANGNMVKDRNKGIESITYNHLNLPVRISFDIGRSIQYTYNAAGQKVGKLVEDNGIYKPVDYLDGFQYAGEILQFFPHAEGYVDVLARIVDGKPYTYRYKYVYNYTDHLGNIRMSYTLNPQNNKLEILEENHYFPFGLKHSTYIPADKKMLELIVKQNEEKIKIKVVQETEYQYKYNGKEWQDELGLNFYDYGARNYDPAIGRWMNVDPLAETTPSWSPYAYAFNNPLRYIDPTGMSNEDFVQRKDGSIYWDNKANDQATTKAGDTYLGKNLSFTFNSYISDSYDGPLGSLPEGDKLTTTINISASENSAGELTGLSASFAEKSPEIGKTFGLFSGRDYYPGEGGSNNYLKSNGTNVNYEQHASVPSFEEKGLNSMGYKIVDVAQKLNISFDKSSGNLSINAYTNVFPSATLKLNNTGTVLMNYKQPSFVGTHTAPITGYSPPAMGEGRTGGQPIRDFSYYPSRFYKRN